MRFNKKAIAAVQQDVSYCRCVHDSSLHDKNGGCHGEVVRFKCERRGHDFRDDPHGESCIIHIRCPCTFQGAAKAKMPTGTIVLGDEKQ